MRLVAAVTLFALAVSSPALAKDPPKKKKTAQRASETDDDSGSTNSSARNAKGMSAGVLFTPLSDFVLQFGVGGTFNVSQDMQAGVTFLTGSDTLKDTPEDTTGIEITQADLSGMAFYGHARYFVDDTFNVLGGLGYRSATFDYKIEDTTNGDYLKGNLDISSIIMPIAIGNMWNWDNGLVVGVDWLTIMVAISGDSSGSTETTFAATSQEVEDLNDDMVETGEGLSKLSSMTLALLYLGWSF